MIADEYRIYDPNDSNDRLLLGFKGTISEFELLGIRERMIGGQLSAARRGALKLKLPIGLVYNERDEVVFDSDRSVVDAIEQVFKLFRRKGSGLAVVKWMWQENIHLPSRPHAGPCRGQLRWNLPSHAQVLRILKNPRYAGTYVYGRTRGERGIDGSTRSRVVPMDQWQVTIPNAHVGFIDWEEYGRNCKILATNAAAYLPREQRIAAPRKGAALLQSRVLCGNCGRRMTVQYTTARPSRNQKAQYYYQCKEKLVRYGKKTCQSIRADGVDEEISRFVVAVMNQQNLDLALAVQEQIHTEFAEVDAQHANRIEKLRYEAHLAQRRFFEVDPANRLVAATLEADWNDRLRDLEQARDEREARAAARNMEISDQQMQRIQQLTQDFEQVWNASDTENTDRKRLLGLLIEDATLRRDGYQVMIQLRMRGGKALTLDPVWLPKPIAQLRKTNPETIFALDQLLETHNEISATEKLNRDGHRNWKGGCYSVKHIRYLRFQYNLQSYLRRQQQRLRTQGYRTASEIAEQLGVNPRIIHEWGRKNRGVTREIISTGERQYYMYKIQSDCQPDSLSYHTAKVNCGSSEKATNTQQVAQGAL